MFTVPFSGGEEARANAAYLLTAYLVVVQQKNVADAFSPFLGIHCAILRVFDV